MLAKEDFNFSKMYKKYSVCVPEQTKFESDNGIIYSPKLTTGTKNAECYSAVLGSILASSDTVESEGRQMSSVE